MIEQVNDFKSKFDEINTTRDTFYSDTVCELRSKLHRYGDMLDCLQMQVREIQKTYRATQEAYLQAIGFPMPVQDVKEEKDETE